MTYAEFAVWSAAAVALIAMVMFQKPALRRTRRLK